MRVIFLDIDGVLNGHEFNATSQSNGINPECVERLNQLIQSTSAKVVISSAWRYMVLGGAMTVRGFQHMLQTHGMCHSCVIGITVGDEAIEKRGDQISEWLSRHPEVQSYIILDNLEPSEFGTQAGRLIQTNSKTGITDDDAITAHSMLMAS